LSLSYDQVLALPQVKRVVDMPCVEGWTETLLYEGVRLMDLLATGRDQARRKHGDLPHRGQALQLPPLSLDYVKKADVLLGFKINGLTLDQKRGYPFQVVASHKLGYKWVKWVERIELSETSPMRASGKSGGIPIRRTPSDSFAGCASRRAAGAEAGREAPGFTCLGCSR
jgi:DMSO/TMAO reductase YedYZ molybdopterin-dependent catalytic subunit